MATATEKLLLATALALSLMVVTFPRFDCQDLGSLKNITGRNLDGSQSLGDAPHYINYVEYFRDRLPIDRTPLPFRYRPFVPFLASLLPVSRPMTAINVVNLFSLYVALIFLLRLLRTLEFSFRWAALGGMMYTVSFPMLYFGTIGYVDSVALAVIVIGTYLVYIESWVLLALLMVVGAATKETCILLVPVAFGYLVARRDRYILIPAVLAAVFAATTIVIRSAVATGRGYYWTPGVDIFMSNIRFRTVASLLLTLGMPGLVALGYLRLRSRITVRIGLHNLLPLFLGIASTLAVVAFSMLTAYTDGRFIWPITVFAIPIALWVLQEIVWADAKRGASGIWRRLALRQLYKTPPRV